MDVGFDDVTLTSWNVYESLDDEEMIAGFLREALSVNAAFVVKSLADAAVARLVNQIADTTDIDREWLCAVFAGTATMDDGTASKVVSAVCQTPALVAIG
jgi:probable addiction module antidote protein